jgi:glycogen debranching enzyme
MLIAKPDRDEAVSRAAALMKQCISVHGFLASSTNSDNYRRIWARDGIIIGLAALMTGDSDMIDAFRNTLKTLSENQGPHGEIPSNVDPVSGRISYGGMTGRVDADLWFVIGCGEYWQTTGDKPFIETMMPAIEKVIFLLGAWEFNHRGLLYVPATGDWADEYIHNGYILYDQLLYLQALRTAYRLRQKVNGAADHAMAAKIGRLKKIIRANYWFNSGEQHPDAVYHDILYEKGRKAAHHCTDHYWMPFFSPHGYGYRFDGFANVLASLLGVSTPKRRRKVDMYIEKHVVPWQFKLLPAFHPVIKPVDKDWEDLQITFSYSFKNRPNEFHNGGLWPMITGFYVADLARRGETEKAGNYLDAIHGANALPMDGASWSFPEFVNGRDFTAGGTHHQCWSASAAIMGHLALEGKTVFNIYETDTTLQ